MREHGSPRRTKPLSSSVLLIAVSVIAFRTSLSAADPMGFQLVDPIPDTRVPLGGHVQARLRLPPTAPPGSRVCAWLVFPDGTVSSIMCEPFSTDLSLHLTLPGLHELRAGVAPPEAESVVPTFTTPITAVERVEFVPTYEYQSVESWQAVAPGLEINLKLDGSGTRLARIPEPWRLQVLVGRAFPIVRLDVTRAATLGSVKNAVSSATGVPSACLYLHPVENSPGSMDHFTVSDLSWFNNRSTLKLKVLDGSSSDGCPP